MRIIHFDEEIFGGDDTGGGRHAMKASRPPKSVYISALFGGGSSRSWRWTCGNLSQWIKSIQPVNKVPNEALDLTFFLEPWKLLGMLKNSSHLNNTVLNCACPSECHIR